MSYWEILGFIFGISMLYPFILPLVKKPTKMIVGETTKEDKRVILLLGLIYVFCLPFILNYTIEKGIKLHVHIKKQIQIENTKERE
jgi:cytochrome bd-type quinol oxidase subunit 2